MSLSVARDHGIPLLVDAAAQLPPADNLRRFIPTGADLVAFSGGKAIGGPQASGILCGRADLVLPRCCRCWTSMCSPTCGRRRRSSRRCANCRACRITASAVPARLARRRSSACLSRSNVSSQATTQRDARTGDARSRQSLRQRTTRHGRILDAPVPMLEITTANPDALAAHLAQRTIRRSYVRTCVAGTKACCCSRPCRSPPSRPQSSAGDYAGTKRGTAQRVELPRQHSRVTVFSRAICGGFATLGCCALSGRWTCTRRLASSHESPGLP